jgi:hypothetical protein
VPAVPDGKDVLVMESADSCTVSEPVIDLVRAGLDESLTVIVTGKLPPNAGAPETMPVLVARVSPVGSFPPVTDQVYGVVPPVAARVFE